MNLSKAAADLVAAYQSAPGAEPLDFTRTEAYRQFIEAAERQGFTSSELDMDSEAAERRSEWVAHASKQDLQRWVHTLIRSDRWNGDWPDAVWMACRSGCMGALVQRLASL